MANQIDQNIYSEARARADELKAIYANRDANFDKYQKMYLMTWSSAPDTDGIQVTISPDARNKVLGAKRLLTSTTPKPSIVKDSTANKADDKSDDLEEACKRILAASGKAFRGPLHYAAVESALLYGEIHMSITDTAALAAQAGPINKAAADELALQSPHLIEVWNPRYGYPEWDMFGLSGYLRRVMQIRAIDIPARFGQAGEDWIANRKPTDLVELDIWWDRVNYAAWVEGVPLIAEAHGLPYIPISTTLVDGSTLFGLPEEMRQPLLYGLEKSGFWERQNLALTVMYTNIFNIGINPTFLHNAPPSAPDKKLAFDGSTPGGVIDLEPGETLQPMVTKGVLDPSFAQGVEIAQAKSDESTIYGQTLGAPMNGSPAYSTISMMSQQGRLPLITTQKMCETAISNALEMCLKWYKSNKKALKGWPIKPADISDTIQVETKMDVDLPQDKLQMANVAGMIMDKGMADMQWVRQNILNIQENQTMDEDVASDKFFAAMVQAYMQAEVPQMIQELQQQRQAQAGTPGQPGMQPGQPGQQGPIPQDQVPANAAQSQGPDMQQLAQMQQQQALQGNAKGPGFNPAAGGMSAVQAGQTPLPGAQQ